MNNLIIIDELSTFKQSKKNELLQKIAILENQIKFYYLYPPAPMSIIQRAESELQELQNSLGEKE
jgi:hypothetical protein